MSYAESWSWDPATILGMRDANRSAPLLPPIQPADGGQSAYPLPPINYNVNPGNENYPPSQLMPPPGTGKPYPHNPYTATPNVHHYQATRGDGVSSASPVPIPYYAQLNAQGSATPPSAAYQSPVPAPMVSQASASTPSSNAKKPAASRKRKSDVVAEPENLPEIDDEDPRLEQVDQNCNQIRAKIRRFIESGAMKVGEFQKAIDVSSAAYSRYMKQNGPDAGSGSDVYYNAFAFFKKRELQGLKAVPAKKAKAASGVARGQVAESLDVSGVKLDGEEEGDVPVFDTCDEVRKKIRAVLRKDDVTQAAFLREIGKSFPAERKVQSKQLNDFLTKNGPTDGNTSCVYYGSYVLFEKLRVKQGKPKTEMRLEMEKLYSGGKNVRSDGKPGMNTTERDSGWVFLRDTESMYQDKYGKFHIVPKGGRSKGSY